MREIAAIPHPERTGLASRLVLAEAPTRFRLTGALAPAA